MRIGLLILVFCLTGCTTAPGVKWYAPATWFSHAPADKVDLAEAKVEAASTAVIKAAQKSAHETQVALLTVPDSRSTTVATQSNDTTVALLDQVAGPLSASDLAKIKDLIAGLTSENAELRAKAERERAQGIASVNEVSRKLQAAVASADYANAKLRDAFERENALANELRAQRALIWIAGGAAVLLGIAWLYVRLTLGGLPTALGRSLNTLRATAPDIADRLVSTLDVELSPSEQALIRLMAAKHKQ